MKPAIFWRAEVPILILLRGVITVGHPKALERIKRLTSRACEFEGQVIAEGKSIREQSKRAYGKDLLDTRLLLISALVNLLDLNSGVPGKTDEKTSQQITLFCIFTQGISVTEELISEGQYSKATAALKQDYEILARLEEVEKGKAKPSKTPNVKHAPYKSQHIYGYLNKVAHPSNHDLLRGMLFHKIEFDIVATSPFRVFNATTAKSLYQIHVFTLIHIVRKFIELMTRMYPEQCDTFKDALILFETAMVFAEKDGFAVETN